MKVVQGMVSNDFASAYEHSVLAYPTTALQSVSRGLSRCVSASSITISAASKGLTVVGTKSTAICCELSCLSLRD